MRGGTGCPHQLGHLRRVLGPVAGVHLGRGLERGAVVVEEHDIPPGVGGLGLAGIVVGVARPRPPTPGGIFVILDDDGTPLRPQPGGARRPGLGTRRRWPSW